MSGLTREYPVTETSRRRTEVLEQKIRGFHRDEHQDWVAELECGHTQHVRHNPPWTNRPWVTTLEGRNSRLGTTLVCKKCEQDAAAQPESNRS